MDKNDTSHDFNPKHRIVGAIVLVALAVIFLPMLLKDDMPTVSDVPVPEVPTPDTRVVVTPVTPTTPEAPPSEQVVKTIPSLVAPPIAPIRPTPPGAEPAAPAPAPAPVSETPAKPVKAPEPAVVVKKGWIVQLGVFSQTDNATRMKDDLKRHGYSATFDKISLDKGQGVRVRVGPYPSESEARSALARIQKDTGIKGVVRVYP